MSIAGRIYDLARANLGALFKRDPGDGELEGFSDAELAAELELRKQRRRRKDESKTSREAAERAGRERSARQQAAAGTQRAQSKSQPAGGQAKTQAGGGRAQAGGATAQSNGAGASSSRAGAGGVGAGASNGGTASRCGGGSSAAEDRKKRMAVLYAQLETPDGADRETLKTNFRRLMRKHHPDLNGGTPEKQRAATERTARLTGAYDELERLIAKR